MPEHSGLVRRGVQNVRVVTTGAAAVIVALGLAMLTATLPVGAQTGTTISTDIVTVSAKIKELNDAGIEIRHVAFTPTGSGVILYGRNDAWVQATTTLQPTLESKIDGLVDTMRELINANKQVYSVAIDSDGCWVILHSGNEPDRQEATWRQCINASLAENIRKFYAEGKEMREIAFAPDDTTAWSILFAPSGGFHSASIPKVTLDKLNELASAGTAVRGMAYSPGGGWVILHGRNDLTWNGIPQRAIDKIRELYAAGRQMKQIAFTASGGWIILWGSNGYDWVGLQ